MLRLRLAVQRHGRDWKAVSCDVGSKASEQCMNKVIAEVAAGRVVKPGGKHVHNFWSKDELLRLKQAVCRHGRDWVAVSSAVGSKTRQQCQNKVTTEARTGRMQDPGGKRVRCVAACWSRSAHQRLLSTCSVSRSRKDGACALAAL